MEKIFIRIWGYDDVQDNPILEDYHHCSEFEKGLQWK